MSAACYGSSRILSPAFSPLLHLEPQQVRLRAADGGSVIAALIVEGVAACVQGINLSLAPFLLVRVLSQTTFTKSETSVSKGTIKEEPDLGLRTIERSTRLESGAGTSQSSQLQGDMRRSLRCRLSLPAAARRRLRFAVQVCVVGRVHMPFSRR